MRSRLTPASALFLGSYLGAKKRLAETPTYTYSSSKPVPRKKLTEGQQLWIVWVLILSVGSLLLRAFV